MRLDSHTDFLGTLLHLTVSYKRTKEVGPFEKECGHKSETPCAWVRITFVFSTASSIFSTMAESSTCRSHDVLLMELTGWLFNHDVISATFSAL